MNQRCPLQEGDWVLIHVGFATSKISAEQAEEPP
jgi:hydrogenase maturation factor